MTLSSDHAVAAAAAHRTLTGATALHALARIDCRSIAVPASGCHSPQQVCHVVLDRLLSGGVDMRACMRSGDTALHLAAASGHAHMVEVMLSLGCEADKKNAAGHTPLFLAAAHAHPATAAALLAAGANPDMSCGSSSPYGIGSAFPFLCLFSLESQTSPMSSFTNFPHFEAFLFRKLFSFFPPLWLFASTLLSTYS